MSSRPATSRLLQTCCLTLAAAGLLNTGSAAEPTTIKSSPDVIVYRGTYPGWPWIAAGADGTLYCVFREGAIHGYSPTGKAMFTRSTDHGKTWSPAEVIADAPDIDDRNVAITELPNRELLVNYNIYTKARQSEAMVVRSSDHGKTWSAPQSVGRVATRTRAAIVLLSDGTLLLPMYSEGPGAVRCALAGLSADQGKSWNVVEIPNAQGFVGDEWDALEVEPGRILCISRNRNGRDGVFWKTESRDRGRTWDVPRPTNVASARAQSPAQLMRLGKTVTLLYPDRRMVSISAVRTSDPDFLRWDVEHLLPCYVYQPDQTPIADGSYAVSAPVGGRQRLIVDYEIRKDAHQIAGYFVTFPDNW